jgi:excisionase family DNA binding protein
MRKNDRSPSGLMSVAQLAEYLNVGENWVYRQVRLKKLPYLKVGKYLRFKINEVEATFRQLSSLTTKDSKNSSHASDKEKLWLE